MITAVLAPRTRVEYDRDWSLFDDWCAAAGLEPLPADPTTVVEFLEECPGAPTTQMRRVAAIDSRHIAAGLEPPGRSDVVRAALGRSPLQPVVQLTGEQMRAALLMLPSRSWTLGLFGRRDRALLVLAAAGVTSADLAAATAGDAQVGDGTATLRTGSGVVTLERHNDDPTVCGPCAVGRWLRLLRLIADGHSHRRWIRCLRKSPEITAASPHQCAKPVVLDEAQAAAPLIPRIDQWGYLETRLEPIGTRTAATAGPAAAGRRERGVHPRTVAGGPRTPPAAEPASRRYRSAAPRPGRANEGRSKAN